jgi:uncharacterized membrane protein YfhO
VETEDPAGLAPYLQGEDPGPPDPSGPAAEVVTVRPESPTRTVIEARLRRSGLVVLADRFASGWRLTIDGQPAPILRANLLMRAAAVTAGAHTLIYTYRPDSVRIGGWISMVGLVSLLGLAARGRIQGRGTENLLDRAG